MKSDCRIEIRNVCIPKNCSVVYAFQVIASLVVGRPVYYVVHFTIEMKQEFYNAKQCNCEQIKGNTVSQELYNQFMKKIPGLEDFFAHQKECWCQFCQR